MEPADPDAKVVRAEAVPRTIPRRSGFVNCDLVADPRRW
jgi:hypothetical protein